MFLIQYVYENNIEKSKEIAIPSVQAQKWNWNIWTYIYWYNEFSFVNQKLRSSMNNIVQPRPINYCNTVIRNDSISRKKNKLTERRFRNMPFRRWTFVKWSVGNYHLFYAFGNIEKSFREKISFHSNYHVYYWQKKKKKNTESEGKLNEKWSREKGSIYTYSNFNYLVTI